MSDLDPKHLASALATELDVVRRALETLAGELCLDDAVASRHAVALQQFDYLAQSIGEVAAVLRHTGRSDQAIGAIRLDTLQARLRSAIGIET